MFTPFGSIGFGMPGTPELIVILVIVLIIFGPKSLPTLGRSLGKGLREFKSASSKFTEALNENEEEEDIASKRAKNAPRQLREESAPPVTNQPPSNSVATSPNGTAVDEKT